jgi:hypothetical protein
VESSVDDFHGNSLASSCVEPRISILVPKENQANLPRDRRSINR